MAKLNVQGDESIPTRAKKGQKSKKAVRDEVSRYLFACTGSSLYSPLQGDNRVLTGQAHEGVKESLKNLSKASNWTVGKW